MATITSTTSGSWSAGATWVGGTKPADGDAVVIDEGHSVLMDEDTSGFTGLFDVTINSSDSTPGMLYFKNGTDGYLKIRTGYQLIGTSSGSNKGRVLANSDGVWGNTGALSISNTAIMEFATTTTHAIIATNLQFELYCAIPTYKHTLIYGTKYDFTASSSTVDVSANTIDLGTTPPSAGTKLVITTSGGTLPGGLEEDTEYYVRDVSGDTCKLSLQNNDTWIVDLTSTGSGTCSLLTSVSSGSATVNVYTDVTGDSTWTTTSGMNMVYLSESLHGDTTTNDIQYTTLSSISAGSITLGDVINSSQNAGSRIYLAARNIQLLFNITSTSYYAISDIDSTSNIGALIYNSGGSGRGIYNANNTTVSNSVIANFYYTIYSCEDSSSFEDCLFIDNTLTDYANSRTSFIDCVFDNNSYVTYASYANHYGCHYFGNDYVLFRNRGSYFDEDCIMSGNYYGIRDTGGGDIYYGTIKCGTYGIYASAVEMYGNIYGMSGYAVYGGASNCYGCRFYANDDGDVGIDRGHNTFYGCSMESTTIFSNTESLHEHTLHISYDHDGVAGHIKALGGGGETVTEDPPGTPPVSLNYAYKTTADTSVDIDHYCWLHIPIWAEPGKLLRIKIYEKCNDAPSVWTNGPRFQLVDPAVTWIPTSEVLQEVSAETDGGDDTDWHTLTLEHRSAGGMLFFRTISRDTTTRYYHWRFELQNASCYALQFRGV